MADQRQVRRYPESTLRVTFDGPAGGPRTEAAAWDASLGGMFLETERPLDEGSLITLELRTAETTVSADARVLWSRPSKLGDDQPAGMAVRFIDLPDDVSLALSRALQGGMREKTILGVGGVSREPTQLGIAAPPAASAPTPRETQIGVAPPASRETQLGVAPPANAQPQAKARLVVSETSLPDTALPATPAPSKAVDTSRLEETAPSKARFSTASELPPRKRGIAGRLFLSMLLGGAAAGAYLYRDKLAELVVPPVPSAPTAAPTASAPVPPPASASAHDDEGTPTADASAATTDASAAAAAVRDAGADAASVDAGIRDAGARDGGKSDAGPHGNDAGTTKTPHAAPKHS